MRGRGSRLQPGALVLLGLIGMLGASDGRQAAGPPASTTPRASGSGDGTATIPLGAVSGGYRWWGPPYYATIGPDGQPMVIVPAPLWPPTPVLMPVFVVDRGPTAGPMPRPAPVAPPPAPVPPPKPPAGKLEQLLLLGDRLFRAGNLRRAEERYLQAVKLDASAAEPRIRLAEVAIVREHYREAAERVREAIAADPRWLARAADIRLIYGEPRDFDRTVARLESHLLLEPTDRDAWLVLGAQLYLSGQTRRSADVFVRLTDRKPDAALAAFLDAARPAPADRRRRPGAGGLDVQGRGRLR